MQSIFLLGIVALAYGRKTVPGLEMYGNLRLG